MRTIEVKLYKYNELPTAKAKAKALDWMREGEQRMWTAEWEFAETAARKLGIVFATTEIKLMNGKTRTESDIRYSGFYAQGSGLSFAGRYQHEPESLFKIMTEFPQDDVLQGIARHLAELQAANSNNIVARISQNDRYFTTYAAVYDAVTGNEFDNPEIDKAVQDLMRSFADWIYDGIREDYEYRLEDGNLEDSLMANEYEFHEDGRRACV